MARESLHFTYAGGHFAAGQRETVQIDEQIVYENEALKQWFFYISDEQFFFANSTPHEMKNYYKALYPNFHEARYQKLLDGFGLDGSRKIRTFSKGMKKQVSVICGVSANTDYLFCDETFDGWNLVARRRSRGCLPEMWQKEGLPLSLPPTTSENLRTSATMLGCCTARDFIFQRLGGYENRHAQGTDDFA